MIHIYVEQAKNLDIPKGQTIDPIIEVNCLNEQKFSKSLKDINNVAPAVWNEHLFFEPKNVEVARLEKGKVEIKILDKGFYKNSLIGYYEFDLNTIYLMKDHALMHTWIVMNNPEGENFGKVTAYLKLSITVCGPGDEQIPIEDDPNPQEENYMQPPQIQPQLYQLHCRFYTGQKIVPMDSAKFIGDEKVDAFIQCFYKGQILKTKVLTQKKDQAIDWN